MGIIGHLLALGLLRACNSLAPQIVAAILLGRQRIWRGRLWDGHLACMHVPAKVMVVRPLINTSEKGPAIMKEA